ncbi:MAG: 3-hydroxyacyl-CoA dehydrogenase, partial [Pseudomonadota bacterium]|nr:3-hydroxyacyl-CoA dehydrogenase [Pseudomonadota bacterium]
MLDPNDPELVIGVVGTGTMGRGIAQIAAAAGIEVRLLDVQPGAGLAAREAVAATFDMLAAKGRMTPEAASAAAGRLRPVAVAEELAGSDIVVEAIVEDLGAKQELFAELEGVVADDCLLATNTSSLSVTAIAAACRAPGRVAGLHFFNPVPLMKVVEVIDGALTEAWVAAALAGLAERMGHRPVRAADTPGFIVNHAGRGFGGEALRILQEGVTTFDEIDRILREAAGFRMGPFELLDLTGLDVSHPVMESVYRGFYEEPRFRPSYLLRQRLEAGLLGRKSGRGFYAYKDGKQEKTPAPELLRGEMRPVWVSAKETAWRAALTVLVAAAGWPLDDGEKPGADSLCLVTPLGHDITTAALAEGLDPARTIGVDMLFGLDRRRSLMVSPATEAGFAASAAALLAADGAAVSRLRDSPGFVAQRVVAAIVN